MIYLKSERRNLFINPEHCNSSIVAKENIGCIFMKNKPQIHADECRFNILVSSFIRASKSVFAPFAYWYEKINNELVRTPYELTLPEFVSVRFSSLFFSCLYMNQGFITDFSMRLKYAPQRARRTQRGSNKWRLMSGARCRRDRKQY